MNFTEQKTYFDVYLIKVFSYIRVKYLAISCFRWKTKNNKSLITISRFVFI